MADMLQEQYTSVFSNPQSESIKNTAEDVIKPPKTTIDQIEFSVDDIIEAINEIDPLAATSDGDIPARIIKGCKTALAPLLLRMWSDSMNSSMIPPAYKEQFITPIHKKDCKTEAKNYRPVSLTSHIIKIFERIVRKKLVNHLEENNMLSLKQHGFRKGRSCLTQLLQHIDFILENYGDNAETDVIYLDYAKAFDKVDHNLLLQKLKSYGIVGKLYDWIKEFLTSRTQTVMVDGFLSAAAIVLSGVPQGSVLGPILFLIYVNDMEFYINHSKIGTFCDDTRLSKKIMTEKDTELLQEDLDNITQWSKWNNMELHEDKFDLMSYRTPRNKELALALPFLSELAEYITSMGITVTRKDQVKDLGVLMSDDFSWSPHIRSMTDNARRIGSWVLGVFKDRSCVTMLQLYKSLVRSLVEYSSPVWNPSKVGDIQKIENIQRSFTRKISGMKDMNYWERLKRLDLMSLQRRRERYILIHAWKIINKLSPNDLCLEINTNKRLGTKLIYPALKKKSTAAASTTYDCSFAVKAVQLWNILPKDINTATTLESFKTKLGGFLKTIPDNPPTVGYSTPNGNSLVDWKGDNGGPRFV